MKNTFLIFMKKELDRFFKDWRMILHILIFPGIILFLIYGIVIPKVTDMLTLSPAQFQVYAINPPLVAQNIFKHGDIDLIIVSENEKESLKEIIAEKKEALLIVFPSNFDEQFRTLDTQTVPEIHFYYNSLVKGFAEQYNKILTVFNAWQSDIVHKFDINISGGGDLADSKDQIGRILSIILPLFLMIFLFSSAMAIVIGATIGEKERGIFGALLVLPISTRELATGKVLGLGILTILCGISGTFGIILALPRLVNNINLNFTLQNQSSELVLNLNIYSLSDYVSLLLIVFSIAFFIVTLIALISILTKTVREAQMFLVLIFMILMPIGIFGIVYDSKGLEWYYCLLPFYNTLQVLSGIFNNNYTFLQILLTVLTNLFYTLLGIEFLSRLLKNEKIIFNS